MVLGLGIREHPRLDLHTRGGADVAIMPRNVAGSGNLHPSLPRAACMYAAKCCWEWESAPIRAYWSLTHSSLQNSSWEWESAPIRAGLTEAGLVMRRGILDSVGVHASLLLGRCRCHACSQDGPQLTTGGGGGIPPQAPTYHSGGGDLTTSLNLPKGGGPHGGLGRTGALMTSNYQLPVGNC